MKDWVFIAAFIGAIGHGSCVVPIDEFFPYGTGAPTFDGTLIKENDVSSDRIGLLLPIKLFKKERTSLFVSAMGLISFDGIIMSDPSCGYLNSTSTMISAYWVETQTYPPGLGDIYFRQVISDQALFEKAEEEIVNAYPEFQNIRLAWAHVGTWVGISRCDAEIALQNTFQMVLASDGPHTFAIFYYNRIDYTDANHPIQAGLHARAGYDGGDKNPAHFHLIDGSCTPAIRQSVLYGSNCNRPGKYVFRVDGEKLGAPGCSKDWPTDKQLYALPATTSVYGHEPIIFRGPCFDETSRVNCIFEDLAAGEISVKGTVLDSNNVACVVPFLYQTGRINVQLEVEDANENLAYYKSMIYVTNYHRNPLNIQVSVGPRSVRFTYKSEDYPNHRFLELWMHFLGPDSRKFDSIKISSKVSVKKGYYFIAYEDLYRGGEMGKRAGHFFTFTIEPPPPESKETALMPRLVARVGNAMEVWRLVKPPRDVLSNCTISDYAPDDLLRCPPTLQQAKVDYRFMINKYKEEDGLLNFFHPGADVCYIQTMPSGKRGGRECCYKYDNPNVTNNMEGKITCSPPSGGTADKYSPNANLFYHFTHDVVPWASCCLAHGGSSSQCFRYYEHRPSHCGNGYTRPRFVWYLMGDPHLMTFDNFNYTFNGHGEYWLMRNDQCDAQVRMIPFKDLSLTTNSEDKERVRKFSENPATATVMSALVFKCHHDPPVQIQMSQQRTSLEVLVNERYFSFKNGIKSITWGGITLWKDDNSNKLKVTFYGLAFMIQLEGGALMVAGAGCDEEEHGSYSGLLGNCDGDPYNDLQLSDGTILPPTSNLSDIHYGFGEPLRISEKESFFIYRAGESHKTFNHPEFVPSFKEVDPDEEDEWSQEVCGKHPQCYYDYQVTLSREFAKQTADYLDELDKTIAILEQEVSMCDALPALDHGYYNLTDGLFVGSKATVICEDGFYLEKKYWRSLPLVCQENKEWSGIIPGCSQVKIKLDLHLKLFLSGPGPHYVEIEGPPTWGGSPIDEEDENPE